MTTATELATAADYNIEGLDQLAQVWAEASAGDPNFRPILPSLKTPSGGGTTWEDKDDPSFEPRRALELIILHSQVTTQLYLTDYDSRSDDESGRPDAWSDDGVVQVVPPETYAKVDALNAANGWALPYPSKVLADCPYNKFVGDPGAAIKPGQTGGKWNAEYHELYVVVRGAVDPVPMKVRVSPASIKNWAGAKGYKNTKLSRGIRLHTIETVLTLVAHKAGKIEYSEIQFQDGRRLDPVLKARMDELAEGIRNVVQGGMFRINGGAQPVLAAPAQMAQLPAPVQHVAPVAAIAAPAAVVDPTPANLDAAFAAAQAPAPAAPAPAAVAPAVPEPVAAPVAVAPASPPAPAPVAPVDPGVAAAAEAFGATPVPAVAAPAPVPVGVGSAAGDDIDF